MAIPKRCCHGSAILSGAAGGDRLLLFGGEGEPRRSNPARAAEPVKPAMLNDLWAIELRTGRAVNLLASSGSPPTPRTHCTLSVRKDAAVIKQSAKLARLKKSTLALAMAQRTQQTTVKAHVGYSAAAMNAPGGGGGAGGGAMAGLFGGAKSKGSCSGSVDAPPPVSVGFPVGNGTRWSALVLGGVTGVDEGYMGPEDSVHLLLTDESGETVSWTPALSFLREQCRQRLQQERAAAESERRIVKGIETAERSSRAVDVSPPGSPTGSPRGRRAAAASAAEVDLDRAVAAGREAFALLRRHSHTAVVTGTVALVFGGRVKGQPTNSLAAVRFTDLATSEPMTQGAPPPARYAHAACADGAGMMLVCGGLHNERIYDDAHVLSLPSLRWSQLRLPHTAPPLAPPLSRQGHGACSIGSGSVLVYGGYASTTTKLGRTSVGGFAPNRAYLLQHSTPAAAEAARKFETELPEAIAAAEAAEAEAQSRAEAAAVERGTASHAGVRKPTVGFAIIGAPTVTEEKSAASPTSMNLPLSTMPPSAGAPSPASAATKRASGGSDEHSHEPMRGVRSIMDDIATASAGHVSSGMQSDDEEVDDDDDDNDEDDNELMLVGGADSAADAAKAVVRAAYEANLSAEQLEEWIGETNGSLAWLGEEESKLLEELDKLSAASAADDEARGKLEAEMFAHEGHVAHLRAHVDAQTKGGAAARNTLESAHVATSQQIQQELETLERLLDVDKHVLEAGAKERIMAKLRSAADTWLREAVGLGAKLASLQPRQASGGGEDGDKHVSRAIQAAAHSRGALVDRVNALRLELASLKVKLAHVGGATTREAEAARIAHEAQLSELSELQRAEGDSILARDGALAEMSELIRCAHEAEAGLLAVQRHEAYERLSVPPAIDDGSTEVEGAAPAGGGGGGGGGGGWRAQQLSGVIDLMRDVASSGGAPAPESETSDAPRGALGTDTALRLAVRRVSIRREQNTGRWMQLVQTASADEKHAQSVAEQGASELTAIRQAERKLRKLEVELSTCQRAVSQSDTAKKRVEARLAKELYFQKLFREGIADHSVVDGVVAPAREKQMLKMSQLRLRAEKEAKQLSKELRVALTTREEEHSARIRAQIQGAVRRMMLASHDEVAATTKPPDTLTAPPAEEEPPAQGGRRMSMVKRRSITSSDLRRPSMLKRASRSAAGGLSVEEEQLHSAPSLLGLATNLASKAQVPAQSGREVRIARKASRCREILRELPPLQDGGEEGLT